MKNSLGESKGDLGISSPLHRRQSVRTQPLVHDHLQSRLRWALEAAWRRIPNTYRWDPNPLPASALSCLRHDHIQRPCTQNLEVNIAFAGLPRAKGGIGATKLKEGRISSRTHWDALSLACVLCSGKKALPLTFLWCSLPICKKKTMLALKRYREA